MHGSRLWNIWTSVWQANLILVRGGEQRIVQNSLLKLSYHHYRGSLKFALSECFQINRGKKSDPILFTLANRFSQLSFGFGAVDTNSSGSNWSERQKKVVANNVGQTTLVWPGEARHKDVEVPVPVAAVEVRGEEDRDAAREEGEVSSSRHAVNSSEFTVLLPKVIKGWNYHGEGYPF